MDIEKEDALDVGLAPTGLSKSTCLIKEGNELTDQIINETDPSKFTDLTQLFELNQRKKDIARTNRLSNLLEVIDDEVVMRFTSCPQSFDNDQLLKYMTSTQQAVNGIAQSINQAPTIQINNQKNEIHINQSGLNRESREKVLSAVQSILSSLQSDDNVIDVDVEEK